MSYQCRRILREQIMMKSLGITYSISKIYPFSGIHSILPFLGLTEVPSGIPDDIVHMDLSHNSIRQLRARDFHEARSLWTLNLKDNDLEHMEKGTDFFIQYEIKLMSSAGNEGSG